MNAPIEQLLTIAAMMIAVVFLFFNAVIAATLFRPWMRGLMAGAPVRVLDLIGMRLRGVPPTMAVEALVTLACRGHEHGERSCKLVQETYLARRGMIHTAQQLADMTEPQLQTPS